MSERRDYIALEWVAGEIRETLDLASQELESYIGNRGDISKLRFCLTHIHQVQGTLKMVEFFGAALLAEEMEGVVNALLQGAIHDSHIDDALFVLRNSITQLPLYLERVRESRHGLPVALLPVLNDLRSVRGESLLSETALFVPDMSGQSTVNENQGLAVTGVELEEVAHKLRQMFQIALLGLIRNRELKKNVNYLAKVCARLTKLTNGCLSQPLWKICIAVLEGLLNGSIDTSVSIKILLRQVDREIKLIIDNGESALLKAPPEKLIKNLLYYVARSNANSRYIDEIRKEYGLETSLLGEGELGADSFEVPDDAVLRSIVNALSQELSSIEKKLNIAKTDISALLEVSPLLRRVCDTMSILGMGKTLTFIREAFSDIGKLVALGNTVDASSLDEVLAKILSAKEELSSSEIVSSIEEKDDSSGAINDTTYKFDHAFDEIVRESRKNLEQAKETIIEFVATQWNHNTLTHLPRLLDSTYERLEQVPLTTAANVIRSCSLFVSQDLLHDRQVPEWQKLDTLADAITSIDYYLERLLDDAESESDAILAVASESVTELGYPIQLLTEEELSNNYNSNTVETVEDVSEITRLQVPVLVDVAQLDESAETERREENLGFVDVPVLTQIAVEDHSENVAATETTEKETERETEEDEVDPEIVEIFVEEAGEVLEAIEEFLPQWKMTLSDEESRLTVKRAFHTLKGSGRMVGATDIGDLAWSIENMLNRISDGSINIDDVRFDLIDEVVERIPGLVTAFELKQPVDRLPIEHLINCANILSNQQNPIEPLSLHYEPAVESSTVELTEQNVSEEKQEPEIDAELIEIFFAEATSHAKILEDFISHCKDLAGPAELTDDIQRALHTLKGSANMAGIMPVAEVVTPIERMVRELRARQIKVDTPIVELLGVGLNLITAGISQLRSSPLEEILGAAEYIELIEKNCDDRLEFVSDDGSEDGGIPPEALNNFLGDSLDIVSDVSEKVSKYQRTGSSSFELRECGNDIGRFVEHAIAVNLSAAAKMGSEVAHFYTRGAAHDSVGEDFFSLALAANDALIDMLDQVAGHQNPTIDSKVFSDIQNFIFSGNDFGDDGDIVELEEDDELISFSEKPEVADSANLKSDSANGSALSASVEAVYGELIDSIYGNEDEEN
ncbi:MAG: chemosensory pili system protein ChpA (sensor histidine kinase/response regulator), partial [Gammaproteobacteria bacterium]